ncbi:MAG: type II secretion system F family protein [Acidobacteria bacterium]|nr:type II secretion system F family protein [Acidobacteriota bacterium]
MPTFVFKGRNRGGEIIVGERSADSREVLRQLLRREQVQLTSVKEKGREIAVPKLGGRGKKVKAKDLSIFTRQFSVMIDAGLPLVQCLEILAQQQDSKNFQQVLTDVRQDVEEGATLAAAMARHPKVFDHLFVNMIEAGEAGGILDLILQRLSTYIEKIVKLRRDVISAMIYPAAVIVIAVAVITVIMIFVIPSFQSIFVGLLGPGEQLPLPTRIVVNISEFIAGIGGLIILAALVGVGVGLRFYYRTPRGQRGEQTGALDAMLGKIADFYEQEVDSAIASLLTLIEPVMIGFLGVTIGGIVIAMYLPLFTLIGKMSQGGGH